MLNIKLPYSKSELNRIMILGSQLKGKLVIKGGSSAADILTLQQALTELGCEFEISVDEIIMLCENGLSQKGEVCIKDSATGFRLLLARLAAQPGGEYLLDASAQLQKRPMQELILALRQMGAMITTDKFPYQIKGNFLDGSNMKIDTSISSQYLSALLLIAPQCLGGMNIEVTGKRVSWEYVELTIQILRKMGIEVYAKQDKLVVLPGSRLSNPSKIEVATDYSSACYFWAMAAAFGNSVKTIGSRKKSFQPDAAFADLLAEMGAEVIDEDDHVIVKGNYLQGIKADMSQMPDQVPTLAVLGLMAGSEIEITNISHLQYKESNRIESILTEIRRCGGKAEYKDGCLRVFPLAKYPGQVLIDPHGDHRLAMAFAILKLKYPEIEIDDPAVVNKSFPDFWTEFRRFRDSE
ncbi:MAG: 3-phosphoshikimate 1-carboxyvinyltransferase [Candidatus Stygibacter australis]|nr:3-phosphoshikimate 1-carboxyvinyltransferase [Candidatus Stygibacter australis]